MLSPDDELLPSQQVHQFLQPSSTSSIFCNPEEDQRGSYLNYSQALQKKKEQAKTSPKKKTVQQFQQNNRFQQKSTQTQGKRNQMFAQKRGVQSQGGQRQNNQQLSRRAKIANNSTRQFPKQPRNNNFNNRVAKKFNKSPNKGNKKQRS